MVIYVTICDLLPAGIRGSALGRGVEPERLRRARQKRFEHAAWPGLIHKEWFMPDGRISEFVWSPIVSGVIGCNQVKDAR